MLLVLRMNKCFSLSRFHLALVFPISGLPCLFLYVCFMFYGPLLFFRSVSMHKIPQKKLSCTHSMRKRFHYDEDGTSVCLQFKLNPKYTRRFAVAYFWFLWILLAQCELCVPFGRCVFLPLSNSVPFCYLVVVCFKEFFLLCSQLNVCMWAIRLFS